MCLCVWCKHRNQRKILCVLCYSSLVIFLKPCLWLNRLVKTGPRYPPVTTQLSFKSHSDCAFLGRQEVEIWFSVKVFQVIYVGKPVTSFFYPIEFLTRLSVWPLDWHYSLKPKSLLIDTQVQIMIVYFRIRPYMSYLPMHDWLLEDLVLCRLRTGRTGCEIWVAMTKFFPKSAFPSTALLLLFLQEISL